MKIRQTTMDDLNVILKMYKDARRFMAEHGNPNQWGNNKPSDDVIIDDIKSNRSYVCVENNKIAAVFCYMKGPDSTYKVIEEGKWINENPYGVVHRITSTGEFKGAASYAIEFALLKSGNLRIDTHKDNYVMQNLLKKLGFTYCGVIYIDDGTPRLAYQKSL